MPDPVTVDHGGVTITTNMATEAALRAELDAPPAEPSAPPTEAPETGPARDEHGRFAKRETAPAPTDTAPPPTETAPPAEPAVEKPRHDPVARMKQALAQKAEAERRAAALEQELARMRQAPEPHQTEAAAQAEYAFRRAQVNAAGQTGAEPQFEQFAQEADPYTAYIQAWARWDHARQLEDRFARYQAEQAAQAQYQTFTTRIHEGAQKYPDWQEALTQADTLGLQVSEVMKAAITASPKAPDIVHFLATHPEECIQLAEESIQTPVAAATVMQRLLESHLMTAAVAPSNGTGTASRSIVSHAKPPVTPVGSSPVVGDEPPGESASAAEHARYWNRKLRVPGTR